MTIEMLNPKRNIWGHDDLIDIENYVIISNFGISFSVWFGIFYFLKVENMEPKIVTSL